MQKAIVVKYIKLPDLLFELNQARQNGNTSPNKDYMQELKFLLLTNFCLIQQHRNNREIFLNYWNQDAIIIQLSIISQPRNFLSKNYDPSTKNQDI